MIVIVNHVIPKDEDTKKTVVKTAEGIEELLRCGLVQMESLTVSDDNTGFLCRSIRI